MTRLLAPIVLLAAAALGVWASQSGAPSSEAQLGERYFTGFGCVRCHTVGGRGGGYGPDLTFVGFRKTPQWIDTWLQNPHAWKQDTVMPSLHLSDPVRGALVAYLSTLKGEAYRADPPWDHPDVKGDPIKRGEMLFNKVGCVGCHGRAGVGGYPNNNVVGGRIPTLTTVADGYSRDELLTKVRVGVPKPAKEDPNGPEPMIYMPSWGQVLKDDELSSLVDYLISLKPKATASKDEW